MKFYTKHRPAEPKEYLVAVSEHCTQFHPYVVVTASDVLYVESDVVAAELCEQGLETLRSEMRSILDDQKILSKRDR